MSFTRAPVDRRLMARRPYAATAPLKISIGHGDRAPAPGEHGIVAAGGLASPAIPTLPARVPVPPRLVRVPGVLTRRLAVLFLRTALVAIDERDHAQSEHDLGVRVLLLPESPADDDQHGSLEPPVVLEDADLVERLGLEQPPADTGRAEDEEGRLVLLQRQPGGLAVEARLTRRGRLLLRASCNDSRSSSRAIAQPSVSSSSPVHPLALLKTKCAPPASRTKGCRCRCVHSDTRPAQDELWSPREQDKGVPFAAAFTVTRSDAECVLSKGYIAPGSVSSGSLFICSPT